MADFMTIAAGQYAADIAEAEKRGATKALRYVAAKLLEHGPTAEQSALVRGVAEIHAETISDLAEMIQSGEVTLP